MRPNCINSLRLFLLSTVTLIAVSSYGQDSLAAGKQIFMNRCASCHLIAKDLTGPALKDVDKRHSVEWIAAFVRSSQTVIKSGDTAANRLFERFHGAIMPDHPDITPVQVADIVRYIKAESERIALLPATSKVSEYYRSYPHTSNWLHHVVYLDLPGNYRPIQSTDYLFWVLLVISVCLLIGSFVFVVRTNDYMDRVKKVD